MSRKAEYRTAILLVTSIVGRDTIHSNGSGFIINNKYIATCYHVYKQSSSRVPIEVKVLYNIKINDTATFYDSTYATLDFKPSKKQYNFKSHVFNPDDWDTDFIILKLTETINCVKPVFDTMDVLINDTLFASGASKRRGVDRIYGSKQRVLYIQERPSGSLQIFNDGLAKEGYSGAPLFTKDWRVIGIIQSGLSGDSSLIELIQFRKYGLISMEQYTRVRKFMEMDLDYSIATAINIKYIIKRYMRGYY
jgi:V8-like Glu-specific endopeptidase